jgi:hypothetical protein
MEASMQRPNSHRDQVRDAERYFPVRIRVARGQLSRDKQYETMCQWLDEQIGANCWFHLEERLPAMPDTFLFYFVAIVDAQAFVDRFSCGVWISGAWPHGGAARTDESDMRWVGDMHRTR